MTDKEKIRAEIERRYNERDRIGDNIRANVYKSLISFIDSMQEEPVSEELEAEIIRYVGYPQEVDEDISTTMIRKAARHFANWQKKQMIAKAADATIGLPYENKDGGYTHIIDVSRPLPVGNNKIAIIFKED